MTDSHSSSDDSADGGIKYLGCKQVFDDWREVARHRRTADHPDVGEVYT